MRKGCEIRRLRIAGIIDERKDLGAMVDTVAPELVSIWLKLDELL